MVLSMLRCSAVGKWTGGAVGAEKGKMRLNPEVSEVSLPRVPVCCPLRQSGAADAAQSVFAPVQTLPAGNLHFGGEHLLSAKLPQSSGDHAAQSADNASACWSTVCTAASCKSGG